MMNKGSSLICAIDRLTTAVSESGGLNGVTIAEMIISSVLATLGGVATVFVVDWIKTRYFEPVTEFELLRRKIDSALRMYACDYTNQIDLATATKERVEKYRASSRALRTLAVDTQVFADLRKRKKYKGIENDRVADAAYELMGLSNSFFTPYNNSDMNENHDNCKTAEHIRELLGLSSNSQKGE